MWKNLAGLHSPDLQRLWDELEQRLWTRPHTWSTCCCAWMAAIPYSILMPAGFVLSCGLHVCSVPLSISGYLEDGIVVLQNLQSLLMWLWFIPVSLPLTHTHARTALSFMIVCAFMCVCLFVRKLTLKPLMRLNYSEQDFPSDRGGMMNVLIPITPLCLILSCIAKEENSVTALPTQTNKVEYKNARVHSFYMLDVLK